MKFVDSNPATTLTGEGKLPGRANYFIGKDPSQWRTGVATYSRVRYREVFPGVDLVYYGNQQQLEYDFVVAPGADPSRISLDLSGVQQARVNASGDLVLKSGGSEIEFRRPVIYQEVRGRRQDIPGRFEVKGNHRVRFKVGNYDRNRTLVIDPTLMYSTYLGGKDGEAGSDIAVDSQGDAYITSLTYSANFPTTPGAYQTTCKNACFNGDVFVTKIDPTGSTLLYSTFIGGSSLDASFGITLDSADNVYLTGTTLSTDYPVTAGAFQQTYGGGGE
jgi:hypothetical protein